MKGIRNTILLAHLLLIFQAKNSFTQPHYSSPEVFSEINGLPNNEVRCLLKDSRGYLWVGTIYGLAKYDGNKFSVFKHQSNTNSISGDVITTIFEDRQGNMLVGANGLSILERKSGLWKNFLHDPNDQFSISNPAVLSIAQESDSIYWVITSNGINKFNLDKGIFHHLEFNSDTRIVNSKIHKIIPGVSITFSVSSLFYKYDLQRHTYRELLPQGYEYSNAITFDTNVVGVKSLEFNKHNLARYDLEANREFILIKDIGNTSTLFSDNQSFYLAYRDRLCLFDLDFNLEETIIFQKRSEESSIEYHCALREENGTFWIGTTKGLFKISPHTQFKFLDAKSGLPNEYIRSLTIDRNKNLWVGVRQGPVYKIPNIEEFFLKRSTEIQRVEFPTPNGDVFATNQILELKNGNLLFVTNRYIFHYSINKQKFTDQYQIANNTQYFSAVEIPEGILIGSLEKPTLFKVFIEDGIIRHDKSFSVSNTPDVIYSLFKDGENTIWVGGEGLYRLVFQNGMNIPFLESLIPPINEANYSSNSIWSILEIDSTRLFVSTTTNGYYIFNKENELHKHFSKGDGLSTDFTCTALSDKNGNLWLSTKEGITFIDSKDNSIKNYPIRKGQYNSDFTFKCGESIEGKILLFGSKQGIMFFHPDSIAPSSIEAPLFVNEFRVFNTIVKRELTHGDTIILRHNENFFSLEFSLLDFRNPQEISYNFQLLNYDRADREVTNKFNSVSYTDVPPGSYTFRLSSRSSSDIENLKTIDILLIIEPAFYHTIWFKIFSYLVVILAIASIVVAIIRRQILYGRLQKMELALLRSQINPHFIFNTLTSIQHTILTSSKDVAVDTLSRFSRLMRMFLDYSRLDYIPLNKAILFYETFVAVHSVNLDETINFKVVVDELIDPERVKISPMLVQPFLENAIVHGLSPKGRDMKIMLEINQANGLLLCVIHDNGIGRKRASEIGQKKFKSHKSMGIEISSQSILLQLKKGRFIKESFSIIDNYDDEGKPTGTTVFLKIPYRD